MPMPMVLHPWRSTTCCKGKYKGGKKGKGKKGGGGKTGGKYQKGKGAEKERQRKPERKERKGKCSYRRRADTNHQPHLFCLEPK